MTHTLTNEQATELHNATHAAGYPADALRINYYRVGGGGMTTLLCVPGNDNAPCYRRNMRGEWLHVSGATLDEWEFAGHWLAGVEALQAEYADDRETTAGLLQF